MYSSQLFANTRLLDSYPAGISITTADDTPVFVYVNASLARITGYEATELLGCSPRVLQGELTEQNVTRDLAESVRLRQPWNGATVNYRKDGSPFRMQWIIFPVYDDFDRLINWGAIQHDVTESVGLDGVFERERGQFETGYFEFLAAYEHTLTLLSHELHDNIGQQVTHLSQRLLAVSERVNRNPSLRSEMADLVQLVHELTIDLRGVMHSAQPQTLRDFGLYQAVAELIRRLNRTSRIEFTISSIGEKQRFDPQHEKNLYRIIQEALTNVIKHSEATTAEVGFVFLPQVLQITVQDNGRGMPDEQNMKPGIGLSSMAHRAATIGANLNIDRASEGGLRLSLTVPYTTASTSIVTEQIAEYVTRGQVKIRPAVVEPKR
jgi:PAS domain S-box-containing protein